MKVFTLPGDNTDLAKVGQGQIALVETKVDIVKA